MEESKNEATNRAHVLFDRFVQATTCKGTLKAFQELCDHLELKPKDHRSFYHKLKSKLNYWKAKALWAKLDKRGSHKDYKKGKVCTNTKVGPGTRWRRVHRVEVACEAGRGQPQPGEASGLPACGSSACVHSTVPPAPLLPHGLTQEHGGLSY